ncbi:MAG: T9SS type A sorting domain-containing protein, partial [Psychroserpens sp.]|nr:T9SS type A sorting domain-containing protein [Psychroserpens sp.]
ILLNDSDYILTPTTDLSGTGRFYLRYGDEALSTIENSLESLSIYALQQSREIVVSGQLNGPTELVLFDIQGRIVLTTTLNDSSLENRVNVSDLSSGVYVVNLPNKDQKKTHKIIIK